VSATERTKKGRLVAAAKGKNKTANCYGRNKKRRIREEQSGERGGFSWGKVTSKKGGRYSCLRRMRPIIRGREKEKGRPKVSCGGESVRKQYMEKKNLCTGGGVQGGKE